jgi:arsenate reductase
MSQATIYHNPACGTSRNTLAMLRHAGIEPEVIEYLKTPPTREALLTLMADAGLSPRQLMRDKGDLYEQLGLVNPALSNEALMDAMMAHPALINRPLVVTERGTRLCRPSEVVLEILPVAWPGPFTKEDGELVRGPAAVQPPRV